MTTTKIIALLIAFLIAASCAGPQPDVDIETTVANFAEAFRSGDYETVEAHIAENYVHVNSGNAPLDRTQWLSWYKGYAEEIANSDRVFESYEVQSLKVARHDDAAYVTGVIRAEGVQLGEVFTHNIRVTNLWVIEDGQWKRAGFHDVASNE